MWYCAPHVEVNTTTDLNKIIFMYCIIIRKMWEGRNGPKMEPAAFIRSQWTWHTSVGTLWSVPASWSSGTAVESAASQISRPGCSSSSMDRLDTWVDQTQHNPQSQIFFSRNWSEEEHTPCPPPVVLPHTTRLSRWSILMATIRMVGRS